MCNVIIQNRVGEMKYLPVLCVSVGMIAHNHDGFIYINWANLHEN